MECAAAIDLLRMNGHGTLAEATVPKHKGVRDVQILVELRR